MSAIARFRHARPLIAGLTVAALGAVAFSITHARPPLVLRPAAATAAARQDPHVSEAIRGTGASVAVSPLDRRLERVSFFSQGRVLAEAAVRFDGTVRQVVDYRQRTVPYGSPLAYQPALVVGLSALFVLFAGVSPWRRIRNVDVAAVLSLAAPVGLLQQRYLTATVLAAVPGLVYLLVRCATTALGAARPAQASIPLLIRLTPGLDQRGRLRLMRLFLIALALTFLMVGYTSTDAVDVIYAVLEGATRLVHGVLPYGHMPGDIVHGDTYPLLSYIMYVPLAAVSPVSSMWDSVDGGLLAAVMAALFVAWALYRAGAGPRRARTPAAQEAGLRAALAWLAFPPLLITVSTGTTDVALAAMLAGALLLHRRSASSTGFIAAAAWFKLAPAALLPIWLAPLRGRRLIAALGAVVGVSVPLFAVLMALGGTSGPAEMLRALSYQFSRGSEMSVWAAPWAEPLQPLVQASVLGLIAGATVRLRQAPHLAEDRARMAALSAAILIGLQLAADYWAFLYLVWVMPLVCLSLLERADQVAERAAIPSLGAAPLTARAALAE